MARPNLLKYPTPLTPLNVGRAAAREFLAWGNDPSDAVCTRGKEPIVKETLYLAIDYGRRYLPMGQRTTADMLELLSAFYNELAQEAWCKSRGL